VALDWSEYKDTKPPKVTVQVPAPQQKEQPAPQPGQQQAP
jgi:hypothetical protein